MDERGRPGVWFYSLDTPQPIANWIARRFFNLNYRHARIGLKALGEGMRCQSEFRSNDGWDVPQIYDWNRIGEVFEAVPGTLEFFLVERYRLFAHNSRRDILLTGSVHHRPYPLQKVELNAYSKRLFSLNGLPEPEGGPVSIVASAGVDVEIFGMGVVRGKSD